MVVTYEDLLNDFKQLHEKFGKVTKEIYMKHSKYTYYQLKKFGGITHFTKAVTGEDIRPSRTSLISEIQRLYKEHGKVTQTIINQYGKWKYDAYKREFGSIYTAYFEAGIPITDSQNPASVNKKPIYTKEEVINDIQSVYQSVGRITKEIYLKHGKYSQNVIYRLFTSWNNAFKESGCPITNYRDISDEELLSELRNLYREFGFVSQSLVDAESRFSPEVYKRRFGFIKACELAGVPANYTKENRTAQYYFKMISSILDTPFVTEKTFDFLINPETGKHLYVDAYYEEYNLCVEYHGEQHFHVYEKYHPNGEEDLLRIQKRDRIKKELLLENGFKYLAIPYWTPYKRLELIHMLSTCLS